MPLSATLTRSSGIVGRQAAERVVVDLEGLEVAGVDADQLGAQRDRPLGLGLVVHLDQRRSAPARGPSSCSRRRESSSSAATISSARSAPAARASTQLVAGDDEVLAQHRDVDRGADRAEVVEAAAEAALLGEHADRGGPAGGVRRGEHGGVGDVGEVALAGAASLDLGDHARARGRAGAASGREAGRRQPVQLAGRRAGSGTPARRGRRARRRRSRRARTCAGLRLQDGEAATSVFHACGTHRTTPRGPDRRQGASQAPTGRLRSTVKTTAATPRATRKPPAARAGFG